MITILKIRLNESSITFIKQLPTVGWFADSAFSRFAHSSLSLIPHVKQRLLLRKTTIIFTKNESIEIVFKMGHATISLEPKDLSCSLFFLLFLQHILYDKSNMTISKCWAFSFDDWYSHDDVESRISFFWLWPRLFCSSENVASTIEDGIKVSFVFSSLFRQFIHTSKSKKIYLCIRPKFRFTQHV